MNFGTIRQLAAMASQGPAAVAGALIGMAPNIPKVLLVQRHAAVLAASAAQLSRGCGDAMADAMAGGRDVSPATIADIRRATVALVGRAQGLQAALDKLDGAVSVDDIRDAYGAPLAARDGHIAPRIGGAHGA
jgi:hypothetical protein